MTWRIEEDQAHPPRRRLVDATKTRTRYCLHRRPLRPRVDLNVTLCRLCEAEVSMMDTNPSFRVPPNIPLQDQPKLTDIDE